MWLGVLRENRVDLQGAPAFTDWFVFCDFFVVAFTDLLSGSAISKYSLTDVHEGNRRDGVTSAACSGFQADLVVRLLRDLFFPWAILPLCFLMPPHSCMLVLDQRFMRSGGATACQWNR